MAASTPSMRRAAESKRWRKENTGEAVKGTLTLLDLTMREMWFGQHYFGTPEYAVCSRLDLLVEKPHVFYFNDANGKTALLDIYEEPCKMPACEVDTTSWLLPR